MKFAQWTSLVTAALAITVFTPGSVDASPLAHFNIQMRKTSENAVATQTPEITNVSSVDEILVWLDQANEIMDHAAAGELPRIPDDALAAVNTVKTVLVDPLTIENGTTESLVRDMRVLPRVLKLVPSIYMMGYWYKPIAEWQPLLSSIWNKPVGIAQWLSHYDWDSYNAALNATSLIIRFTKDHESIPNDEDNSGSTATSTSASSDRKIGDGYLSYLPEFVAQLSPKPDYTLSEEQLRAYMSLLPSSADDTDHPATQDSDVVALRTFLWSDSEQ